MITTHAAKKIVFDLIGEEDRQQALMDSLQRNNHLDSLTIVNLRQRHSEQKALLLNLEKQTGLAEQNHRKLIDEIDKIKPRYSDLIIPAAGGLLAGSFYNGSTGEKISVALVVYAVGITLKHFGVY